MDKHKHHLYPRYMAKKGEIPPWGDPGLVIELTRTQHAMFHYCNYWLWGNLEDLCAAKMLISHDDASLKLRAKLGGQAIAREWINNPEKFSDERKRRSEAAKRAQRDLRGKLGEEAYRKLASERAKNAKSGTRLHEQRSKNWTKYREQQSEAGKVGGRTTHKKLKSDNPEEYSRLQSERGRKTKGYIWINNGSKRTKIPPGAPIPEGWVRGCKM